MIPPDDLRTEQTLSIKYNVVQLYSEHEHSINDYALTVKGIATKVNHDTPE